MKTPSEARPDNKSRLILLMCFALLAMGQYMETHRHQPIPHTQTTQEATQ